MYPDLTGLGTEAHSQRAKSPESDDNLDTHTARSSLTAWSNTLGASVDASTMTDDDDRTLPVYQSHSVGKPGVVSKTMFAVDSHNPGAGFWGAVGLWFHAFWGSFKSCLAGY
jgi:hypothetical protein